MKDSSGENFKFDGWIAPDPRGERTSEEIHSLRYGTPPRSHAAFVAEAYDYLVYVCPTTEMAVKALRAIRSAARET